MTSLQSNLSTTATLGTEESGRCREVRVKYVICMAGDTNLDPTIQTSIHFCNFAELFLPSLTKTYHFQILAMLLILRHSLQWCQRIFLNWFISKVGRTMKRSITPTNKDRTSVNNCYILQSFGSGVLVTCQRARPSLVLSVFLDTFVTLVHKGIIDG